MTVQPDLRQTSTEPPTGLELNTSSGVARDVFVPKLGGRDMIAEARAHVGEQITVSGLVQSVRDFKWGSFIILRDRSDVLQCVLQKNRNIPRPAVGSNVEISGLLVKQDKATGGSELSVQGITLLSAPLHPVPIALDVRPSDGLEVLLDHRPAALRNPWVAAAFKLQSEVGRAFRLAMDEQGFCEIHTPKFVAGGTEGGAQVFSLDYFSRRVSLAQSPQLYKQIGAGAFEGVYEIGTVFRAENSQTSRHLTEFTGLDFEVAFIRGMHDVMDVEEFFIRTLWNELQQRGQDSLALLGASLPEVKSIPRVDWREAQELVAKWGTGAPEKTLDKAMGDAVMKEHGSEFVFIHGYPADERPFYTMPDPANPGYTFSFDLLYNGLEISSGAQRIHDYNELRANMTKAGLNPDNYPGYMEAFEMGMPPHGGGGMGLERLTQMIVGLSNVREATLFPRDVKRVSP